MENRTNEIIELLNFLDSNFDTGIPEALLISNDMIESWVNSEVLKKHGIIKSVPFSSVSSSIITCPGCEEACLMPVEVIPGTDVRPARIFIACDKRDDVGRISIDKNALKKWQIDVEQLACFIYRVTNGWILQDDISL